MTLKPPQGPAVSAIDDGVVGMGSKRLRQPAGDVPHEVGRAWSVSRAVVYGRYMHSSVLQLAARLCPAILP